MAKLKISLRYSKQLTEDYSEEEALALGNFLQGKWNINLFSEWGTYSKLLKDKYLIMHKI